MVIAFAVLAACVLVATQVVIALQLAKLLRRNNPLDAGTTADIFDTSSSTESAVRDIVRDEVAAPLCALREDVSDALAQLPKSRTRKPVIS